MGRDENEIPHTPGHFIRISKQRTY